MKLLQKSLPCSRLETLLVLATKKGFAHVISNIFADGSVGIGFVDAGGLRHAVKFKKHESAADLVKDGSMVTSEVEK